MLFLMFGVLFSAPPFKILLILQGLAQMALKDPVVCLFPISELNEGAQQTAGILLLYHKSSSSLSYHSLMCLSSLY